MYLVSFFFLLCSLFPPWNPSHNHSLLPLVVKIPSSIWFPSSNSDFDSLFIEIKIFQFRFFFFGRPERLLPGFPFFQSIWKFFSIPRQRNATLRYDVASLLAQANRCRRKKLRRLPHIFEKVLELPVHADADVSIEETPDSLRFAAVTDIITGDVGADAIEIYPGVTKILIRGNGVVDFPGTEFEFDLWRFRLPGSTRPELASAGYHDGELVVTVPKGEGSGGGRWWGHRS